MEAKTSILPSQAQLKNSPQGPKNPPTWKVPFTTYLLSNVRGLLQPSSQLSLTPTTCVHSSTSLQRVSPLVGAIDTPWPQSETILLSLLQAVKLDLVLPSLLMSADGRVAGKGRTHLLYE